MASGAFFVDAGYECERKLTGDAPPRVVVPVQVEEHPVPVSAGAVEGEPFLVTGADDDGLSAAEAGRDVVDGIDVQTDFPSPPVSETVQEVQFSPRNMSRSVPTRRMVGSQ
ncbi:hypothetical protein C1N74_16040 (plasmid) [Microbacterium sp. SGAir0570]|nr:hypothetical protein C1N74_16040 [Microbacterium sp. SGAir0570]